MYSTNPYIYVTFLRQVTTLIYHISYNAGGGIPSDKARSCVVIAHVLLIVELRKRWMLLARNMRGQKIDAVYNVGRSKSFLPEGRGRPRGQKLNGIAFLINVEKDRE